MNTVAAVVAAPKPPTLKLIAAALGVAAFNPNPPELNPPDVVLPAPSPPNPVASRQAGRQAARERERERCRGGLMWRRAPRQSHSGIKLQRHCMYKSTPGSVITDEPQQ